jgi:trehalose 6-phosphate synthase
VKRAYGQPSLAGLYREAKVALVTPLRDGMNLVAHEYIGSQDPDDPGVLVLSRFAGAAEIFPEALQVNPFDTDETAEALRLALVMPLAERRERWQALMAAAHRHSIDNWASNFLAALARARPAPQRKKRRKGRPASPADIAATARDILRIGQHAAH